MQKELLEKALLHSMLANENQKQAKTQTKIRRKVFFLGMLFCDCERFLLGGGTDREILRKRPLQEGNTVD
jgi:hypothetical protein